MRQTNCTYRSAGFPLLDSKAGVDASAQSPQNPCCGDIIVEQIGTLGKSCYRRQEGSRGAQGRVEWGSLLEPGRHAISCASAGDDSQGVRNWLFLTLCKQLFTSEWWCFVCSRN